jgi:hypothetical protein
MKTCVRLVPMPTETCFAPLGALGYCLMRAHFLDVIWQTLDLRVKAVEHQPEDKLLDVLVSILAGCRALSQINTQLRPDVSLAQAWGRPRFADQATVARTLDVFGTAQIDQLRAGSEALFRRESLCLRHDLAAGRLFVDIDLTPLPISKHAEGSTKGKLGGKTAMVANSRGCLHPSTMRRCSRTFIQAGRKAVRVTSPRFRCWSASWPSRPNSANEWSCAPMVASAAMPTSTQPWQATGRH